MCSGELAPMGLGGSVLEMNETSIGIKHAKSKKERGYAYKSAILTMVNRDTKQAKPIVGDDIKKDTLAPIPREIIPKEAAIYTDEAKQCSGLYREFMNYDFTTLNQGEYTRHDKPQVHTSTVEGFYCTFKRGIKGIYQDRGKQHPHQCTAEFDFRYSNRITNGVDDAKRGRIALGWVKGKRLTHARPY